MSALLIRNCVNGQCRTLSCGQATNVLMNHVKQKKKMAPKWPWGTMKGVFMNLCVLSQYIKIETFLVQSHVSISSPCRY